MMAPPWAEHHPSLPPFRRPPPLCRAPPHLRSIRGAYLPDDSALCVPSIMSKADTLSSGASHAGINPRSTVSLGQVIYTQGHVHTYTRPLSSTDIYIKACSNTHLPCNCPSKLWKPVTVLTRAVMGVLFKVQRNLVKVWRRSLFEEMQSPKGVSARLLPTPLHGGGGAV